MADFTDGVKRYIKTQGIITNYFPVDFKDNEDISCYQCAFFSRNQGICLVTKEVTPYPQKFVGRMCPFRKNEEDDT